MADLFPNVDEFGAGSCTCQGTMTGCAVCSTANVLLRYGKGIPRLPLSSQTPLEPDMRALGKRMGARHRAADSNNRHGLSLTGICYGGTNWCAYCAYLELRANGLPASYMQLSWAEILHQLSMKHPIIIPGRYGKVPYIAPSTYSHSVPARGRSDGGFGAAHMVVMWQGSTTITVSDSDFGSASRPVVPPHSLWSAAVAKAYWGYYSWGVTVVNQAPPTYSDAVLWGADVPADIRAAGVNTVAKAIKDTGVDKVHWTGVINLGDIGVALHKIGHDYGSVIDRSDVDVLLAH